MTSTQCLQTVVKSISSNNAKIRINLDLNFADHFVYKDGAFQTHDSQQEKHTRLLDLFALDKQFVVKTSAPYQILAASHIILPLLINNSCLSKSFQTATINASLDFIPVIGNLLVLNSAL